MDYLISTEKCCIPHVLKMDTNKPIIVYLDDIFDFYNENTTEINKLINVSNKIILAFKLKKKPSRKNKTRVIKTPHGNKVIKQEDYECLLKIIKPFYYEDFNDLIIKNENESFEYFTPKNLEEAINLLKQKKIIDTLFLNDLTAKGNLINENKVIELENAFDCDCCNLKKDYLKHLYEIKEINALIFFQRHNFNQWDKIVKKINI